MDKACLVNETLELKDNNGHDIGFYYSENQLEIVDKEFEEEGKSKGFLGGNRAVRKEADARTAKAFEESFKNAEKANVEADKSKSASVDKSKGGR